VNGQGRKRQEREYLGRTLGSVCSYCCNEA